MYNYSCIKKTVKGFNYKRGICMLNAGYKKESMAELKQANFKYQNKYEITMNDIVTLHDYRVKSVHLIEKIEIYVNSIANRPKTFDREISETKINCKKFKEEIRTIELESKKVNVVSGSVVGAGAAAGAGVAAFGPTAAMAIATTFGTASTGTAIASLSGAAMTNAALAWIGGGALAAGGGGMAAGNAFLAMAGPVGWAIGGTALAGGGLLANSKNKKVALEAERKTREIKIEIEKLSEIDIKVKAVSKSINEMQAKLFNILGEFERLDNRDYLMFTDKQKDRLGVLINVTRSLSAKLCEKVN